MTLDPARRLAVLREVAAADPDGDVAFLLRTVDLYAKAFDFVGTTWVPPDEDDE